MKLKIQMSKLKTTSRILKLFTFTLLLCTLTFTLLAFAIQPVYASNHCASLNDQHVTGQPTNHKYTGNDCAGLAPGHFNRELECIGTTGSRYFVRYCAPAENCEAKYDEPGPAAPAACNRPDIIQSEIGKIFGQINAPQQIQNFGFGATGISKFLSNLITLIYSLAAVVLILMILWGAWDWMTSEGDKEKLENAKRKLINAIIGIMLFAVAFAVIQVLGTFTGFKFFEGQK